MIRLTVLGILFLIQISLSAQICIKFQEMDSMGLSMTKLDSVYGSAMHSTEKAGVFKGRNEKKFQKAWGTFYADLMQFLANHDFKWGKETYCFNRIYFSPEGNVDYWFFNFKKSDSIPHLQQEKFRSLIIEFSKTYKIKIKASQKYCQCGSVTFFDFPKNEKPKTKVK